MATPTVPRALCKGDTIAFISPSARLNETIPLALDRAKSSLERLGHCIKIIFNTSKTAGFRESVLQRVEEVHEAFRDPEIKAIICTVGGSHVNELLPHLDYELIRANPKIFCGYSDITFLHYAFFTKTGLQTFYGPAAISELGDYPAPMSFTTNHLQHVLQDSADKPAGHVPRSLEWSPNLPEFFKDPNSLAMRGIYPSPGWIWLRKGKVKGRIFGGCLPIVSRLAGTPYVPDYHGKILILETPMGEKMTTPFPLAKTRQSMADLVNVGVFNAISGLVVGNPFAHNEKMREGFAQIILDQCFGTDFPILLNVDFGHASPMVTLPMNALASLDSEKDEFTILEAAVVSK